MPPTTYRYYCLDAAGHLHGADWFHAESADAAIAMIEAKHPHDRCEIWQRARLVGTTSPTSSRVETRPSAADVEGLTQAHPSP